MPLCLVGPQVNVDVLSSGVTSRPLVTSASNATSTRTSQYSASAKSNRSTTQDPLRVSRRSPTKAPSTVPTKSQNLKIAEGQTSPQGPSQQVNVDVPSSGETSRRSVTSASTATPMRIFQSLAPARSIRSTTQDPLRVSTRSPTTVPSAVSTKSQNLKIVEAQTGPSQQVNVVERSRVVASRSSTTTASTTTSKRIFQSPAPARSVRSTRQDPLRVSMRSPTTVPFAVSTKSSHLKIVEAQAGPSQQVNVDVPSRGVTSRPSRP